MMFFKFSQILFKLVEKLQYYWKEVGYKTDAVLELKVLEARLISYKAVRYLRIERNWQVFLKIIER